MKRAYPHCLCASPLRSCLRCQPRASLQLPACSPACNCLPSRLPAIAFLLACLLACVCQPACHHLPASLPSVACAPATPIAPHFFEMPQQPVQLRGATTYAVAWCRNLCSCVVPLVTNKIRIKNCSDSCPLPAGSNLPMQAAGLLTHSICQAFPAERQ